MSGFLVNKSLLDPTVTQYAGGTDTFTLPQSGSTNSCEVIVGGVNQIPGVDFTVSGTTLTLTTAAPAGANFVCARQYFADGITSSAGANSVASSAIQNDAVTGGKLNPALVQGDLIYADGTDTITRLAKGSASQTLQMNGGATAPNWVTVATPTSDLVKVAHTDISGSPNTIDFTGLDTSTYKTFMVTYKLDGSASTYYQVKVYDTSNTILSSGVYNYASQGIYSSGSTTGNSFAVAATASTSGWRITYYSNSVNDRARAGTFWLHDMGESTMPTTIIGTGIGRYSTISAYFMHTGGYLHGVDTAHNGFQILGSSTETFTYGFVSVYGLKD